MQSIREKVYEYFLQGYEEFPAEIVKKMRYLIFLDSTGMVVYFCLFVWRFIIHEQLNYFLGDLAALVSLSSSLLMIRRRRPFAAGNFALCCIITVFLYYVAGDFMVPVGKDMTRFYESLLVIFAGFYCASLFAVRSRQLYALTLFSLVVSLSHYAVLFFLSYEGQVSFTTTYPLLFSAALIVGFGYLSVNVLRLTAQKRGDLIVNIAFYKLGAQGPICFFSEQALDKSVEVSMGGYLYSAIGQGQQYHQGLFGPVPWGNNEANQAAYVYSILLPDSDVPDPRLNKRNYLLITIVLRREMVHLVDASGIEKDLSNIVRHVSDLASLPEAQIQNIVREIHNR